MTALKTRCNIGIVPRDCEEFSVDHVWNIALMHRGSDQLQTFVKNPKYTQCVNSVK